MKRGHATTTSDEARFREVFTATYRQLRAFALRRLGDSAAVDDVVAEVFLVAWRRIDDVPADPREATLWLYQIAQYTVANARRGARRRDALHDRLRGAAAAAHGARAAVATADGDDAVTLAFAFAELSEADRSVLLLAAWEGLFGEELGLVLGCSGAAAATRLSRARGRFEDAVRRAGTDAVLVERGRDRS